jgi:hypothetical protein
MRTEPFLRRAVAATARIYGRSPAVGAKGAVRIGCLMGTPDRVNGL